MESVQPGFLYTVLMWILVIGILVTVHEFGHYLAGRWFGVKAETFSVGFGKELVGLTDRRGTRWKIAAVPLGGYVKFAGDMNAASVPDPAAPRLPHTLQAKPLWQRAIIVAAGPVINFLFAVLVFAALAVSTGRPAPEPRIGGFPAQSPAAAAGLKEGDRILALDGAPVAAFADLQRLMASNTGRPVQVAVQRGGDRLAIAVTPRMVEATGADGKPARRAFLGVEQATVPVGPVSALSLGAQQTWQLTVAIYEAVVQIVTGERSVKDLGGPIKIAQFSGQAAALGAGTFAWFLAFVSINLGFINLLPVPVLDGGHLVLYALEGARRRPLSQRTQELAFMSGFAALLTLMVVLTWNDLASFGVWDALRGLAG